MSDGNASDVRYPDVQVPLAGEEGNAVVLIARVARAIRYQYGEAAADDFKNLAKASKSYDDLLQLIMGTVETC